MPAIIDPTWDVLAIAAPASPGLGCRSAPTTAATESARPRRYHARSCAGGLDRPSRLHAGTVYMLHTMRPFAVAMAGSGELDPFED